MLKGVPKTLEIAGVKLGGQIGENPTVLIGSIFYEGDKLVQDARKGEFDEARAEALIKQNEEMVDQTGNPMMLDVVANTAEAMKRYIDFVSSKTSSPFLIDSPHSSTMISAVRYAAEVGLQREVIYNSINWRTKNEEIEALRDYKMESTILFTFNEANPTIQGRLEILRGSETIKGLIKSAEEAGVKNILIDTCGLDVPDIGPAIKTALIAKEEFACPTGVGSAAVVDMWNKGRTLPMKVYQAAIAAGLTVPAAFGLDFILYGPISLAPRVYHATALLNAFIAYAMKQYGVKPSKSHPLYRIF